MRWIHTVIVSSSITLAACALNQPPPSEELRAKALPNVKTPVQWTSQNGAAAAVADNWLASFNDPALDAIVREAIEYNSDLRMAAARVETAAGYVKLAGATLYPQVNLLARGGGKMSGDSSGLQGAGVTGTVIDACRCTGTAFTPVGFRVVPTPVSVQTPVVSSSVPDHVDVPVSYVVVCDDSR